MSTTGDPGVQVSDNAARFVSGCDGCSTSAGIYGCPTHGPGPGVIEWKAQPGKCGASLGIGVEYFCEDAPDHHGPHGVHGYGGLYTWWRVEWDQTPEDRRG